MLTSLLCGRRAVFEIIADLDARASIDPQFDFGERRHPYDRHTVVDYLAYKRVFPTSVRDFCNLSHWRVERDGSVIVVAQGFEHETCPPVKGNVRGHVEIGGFQLQPLGPRRTHVTYMVQTDLGGSVPAFIVNSVTSKQPLLVKAIRDVRGCAVPPADHTLPLRDVTHLTPPPPSPPLVLGAACGKG